MIDIDYSKFPPLNLEDELVKVTTSRKLLVEPYWTIPGDFEGDRYARYISQYPRYDGVYVRSKLLEKLIQAANSLPAQFRLVIRAGHRPISVQRQLVEDCSSAYLRQNPQASKDQALIHARTFFSDPDTEIPPHVCGAAVDVGVIGSDNRLLDFGSEINEESKISSLYSTDITHEQKTNRLMLTTVMLDADFASCKNEWWHFSYGDQTWAWFYGKKSSLYGLVEMV